MPFEFFPNTNFHDLNLDYILQHVSDVEKSRDAAKASEEAAAASEAAAAASEEAAAESEAAAAASAQTASDAADAAEDYAEHIADPVAGLVTAWLNQHVDPATGYVIDDTLTVQNAAADAKKVGDLILRGRSSIVPLSLARYTGEASSPADIPDNTYVYTTGEHMSVLLGESFPGTLLDNTSYFLVKIRPSANVTNWRYELAKLGAPAEYIGYETGTSEGLVWIEWQPDTTLSVSRHAADARVTGGVVMHRLDAPVSADTYETSPYNNVDAINDNVLVRYSSDLTAEMVPGLPLYGKPWQIMTMRWASKYYSLTNGGFGRLQLAWCAVSNTENTNGGNNLMAYRVSYSQTSTTWRNWRFFAGDINPTKRAGFYGASITWGQTTGGSRSPNNLPALFTRVTNIPSTNNGVKGQGLIKDWATIYGSAAKADGYQFDGYDLLVLQWFANDGTAWSSLPLGTGASSEGLTTIMGYYRALMDKISTYYPLTKVCWLGPKGQWGSGSAGFNTQHGPSGARWTLNDLYDRLIDLCREQFGYYVVDYRKNNFINYNNHDVIHIADGVHYTDDGYKAFAEVTIPVIMANFKFV